MQSSNAFYFILLFKMKNRPVMNASRQPIKKGNNSIKCLNRVVIFFQIIIQRGCYFFQLHFSRDSLFIPS